MAFNQGLLHVSRPLTDLVVSYDPSAEGFLHSDFFPRKPVSHLSDQIRQISKGDLLRLYDLNASGESRPAEVQFRFGSTLSYNCTGFASAAVLDNLEIGNADAEVQFEQRATAQAYLALQLRLEYLAINQTLRSTSVLSNNTTLSAAQRWDNYSSTSSSPLDDLITGCELVRVRTGKDPSVIGMSEMTWNVLAQHPNVLSRMPVHTTGPTGAILTPAILEAILRVPPGAIKISAKTYNSAVQGETAAYKLYMGSDVVIAHTEGASLSDFGLGHEFAYAGYGSDSLAVMKYPAYDRGVLGADIIKVVSIVDYKVTNADAGYLIKTVLDTTKAAYGSFVD